MERRHTVRVRVLHLNHIDHIAAVEQPTVVSGTVHLRSSTRKGEQ